ncbi:hypothetical protein NMY22_g21 [Coprinellus aureogranulatus]|nr:hypothetical protein NMY22_g21 [Coprinellus aureogranulatus]
MLSSSLQIPGWSTHKQANLSSHLLQRWSLSNTFRIPTMHSLSIKHAFLSIITLLLVKDTFAVPLPHEKSLARRLTQRDQLENVILYTRSPEGTKDKKNNEWQTVTSRRGSGKRPPAAPQPPKPVPARAPQPAPVKRVNERQLKRVNQHQSNPLNQYQANRLTHRQPKPLNEWQAKRLNQHQPNRLTRYQPNRLSQNQPKRLEKNMAHNDPKKVEELKTLHKEIVGHAFQNDPYFRDHPDLKKADSVRVIRGMHTGGMNGAAGAHITGVALTSSDKRIRYKDPSGTSTRLVHIPVDLDRLSPEDRKRVPHIGPQV